MEQVVKHQLPLQPVLIPVLPRPVRRLVPARPAPEEAAPAAVLARPVAIAAAIVTVVGVAATATATAVEAVAAAVAAAEAAAAVPAAAVVVVVAVVVVTAGAGGDEGETLLLRRVAPAAPHGTHVPRGEGAGGVNVIKLKSLL